MVDLNWLAAEAKTLHAYFENLFWLLALTILTVGVVCEYFKLPLGSTPEFEVLIGRLLVACILLVATPDIMNALADLSDGIAKELGDLNQFKYVAGRMLDQFKELSWSWVSIKDSVIILIAGISFFALYVTIYLADAFFLYTWMLIYVFSPILIVMYILPVTANITKALFRSMFEVSAWKIVWSVMASLLWSLAASDLNKPEHDINFLTAIILNIILVLSVLLAPLIVSYLTKQGISGAASTMNNMLLAAAALTPAKVATLPRAVVMKTVTQARKTYRSFKDETETEGQGREVDHLDAKTLRKWDKIYRNKKPKRFIKNSTPGQEDKQMPLFD